MFRLCLFILLVHLASSYAQGRENDIPVFSISPARPSVVSGSVVTLTCQAPINANSQQLHYHFSRDGTQILERIANATSLSVPFTVISTDSGNYFCNTYYNGHNSFRSNEIFLSVIDRDPSTPGLSAATGGQSVRAAAESEGVLASTLGQNDQSSIAQSGQNINTPVFSISPARPSVVSGSVLTLTCKASINGQATYYFYMNNIQLASGSTKSVGVAAGPLKGSQIYSCNVLSNGVSSSRSNEITLNVIEWKEHDRTGKQYAVLTSHEDLTFNSSRALCGVEGYLAEPRNRRENHFISGLVDQRVYLGMKYHEATGEWQWESDGTNVSWANWQQWRNHRDHFSPEPNGRERHEYCAMILHSSYKHPGITYTQNTWGDKRCNLRVGKVVCEKNKALDIKDKDCMKRQVEACYSLRNLLYTKKSIEATGDWSFLNNAPWSPNRNALCGNKNNLNGCIHERKTVCHNTLKNTENYANYFMKINHELCAKSTIDWDDWLNPRSVQIWTNNATKAQEAYQGWRACQTNSHEESLMNLQYQRNTQAACSALLSWIYCDLGVAANTGSPPYNDYTKTFVKMIWRATARTHFWAYMNSPYDCTAVKNLIGIAN